MSHVSLSTRFASTEVLGKDLDAAHYVKTVLNMYFCLFFKHFNPSFCSSRGVFHEWTNRTLTKTWNQILGNMNNLRNHERIEMQHRVQSHGICEMHRQTLLFPSMPHINRFRRELEQLYGNDVTARKGDEIIFNTAQLVYITATCESSFIFGKNQLKPSYTNYAQCATTDLSLNRSVCSDYLCCI
jgi:hypothetical protein